MVPQLRCAEQVNNILVVTQKQILVVHTIQKATANSQLKFMDEVLAAQRVAHKTHADNPEGTEDGAGTARAVH